MLFIILFLTLILFSFPVSATYDLNGEWLAFDVVGSQVVGRYDKELGIAQITQTNDAIEAIWISLEPKIIQHYGFKVGDAAFYGKIERNKLTGKIHLHYPVSLKASCPNQWALVEDFELIIENIDFIKGKRKNKYLTTRNCTFSKEEWVSFELKRVSSKPQYSNEIKWGNVPNQFGLQEGEEIETFGPHTFSLDTQGNMYVIDSINGNIKMLNEKGEYQRHIDFTGWGSDIITGRNKERFTLDNESLVVHPSSGKRTQHQLSTDIPQVEGYGQGMRLDDRGNLYLCQFQQCYQIGLAKKGKIEKFLSPEEQMENVMPGFPLKDNRLIRTLWKNNHEAVIEIMDEDWAIVQTIPMKTDDVFGQVGFLRQDDKGFLYIEVERITDDNYVHLEVWKYDKTGKRVAVKKLPNDYYSTVYKKIVINSTGTIYQVITTSKGVKIVKW